MKNRLVWAFISCLICFSAKASVYDECPSGVPVDQWSKKKAPILNTKCSYDSSDPIQVKVRKIFDEIIEANKDWIGNFEKYKKICVSVSANIDGFGGSAETDTGELTLSREDLINSSPDEAIAATIAHELGHFFEGNLLHSEDIYYHPDLMANPEYRNTYNSLVTLERNDNKAILSSLEILQKSLPKKDKELDEAVVVLKQRVAIGDKSNSKFSAAASSELLDNPTTDSLLFIFDRYGKGEEYSSIGSPMRNILERKLTDMAAKVFPNGENTLYREFLADQYGFQILMKTKYNPQASFNSLFSKSTDPAMKLSDNCREQINRGMIPAIQPLKDDSHPNPCRRFYETTMKMPACMNSSTTGPVDSEHSKN